MQRCGLRRTQKQILKMLQTVKTMNGQTCNEYNSYFEVKEDNYDLILTWGRLFSMS